MRVNFATSSTSSSKVVSSPSAIIVFSDNDINFTGFTSGAIVKIDYSVLLINITKFDLL